MNNPRVTIEMENGKKIVAELYPDKTPNPIKSAEIALIEDSF